MKLKAIKQKAQTSIKKATERKEGGTTLGNLLRVGASTASHGILGQGAMMIKPGETKEQANEGFKEYFKNAMSNAGFGVALGNQANDGRSIVDDPSAMKGKAMGFVKGLLFPIVLVVVVIGGIVYLVKKGKGKKSKK